jgi:nitrogen fixation protein FixH
MSTHDAAKPLTGRKVLVCLLAFFGVVVAVNVVMMVLAVDTLPGTEVDSPYRASLAYNGEIAAARAQARRDWRVSAHVERAPDGRAEVRIRARDHAGAPLTGLAFTAQFERPVSQSADRRAVLSERESGVYQVSVDGITQGQWDLIIEADRGGERLFLSRNRVVLK